MLPNDNVEAYGIIFTGVETSHYTLHMPFMLLLNQTKNSNDTNGLETCSLLVVTNSVRSIALY